MGENDEPIMDEPDYEYLALVNELKSLHQLRSEEVIAQEKYDAIMQKFQEDNADTITKLKEIKEKRIAARETIKKLGADEYRITGKKQLIGGLAIRILKKLEYAEDTALKWALEHKLCLQFDKKAFEKLAKSQPIDFVTITEIPQVTIPSVIKIK